MAIPIIFSLYMLLKVELASGLAVSNRIAHAMANVNQQLTHLNAREDLTIPLDQLMVNLPLINTLTGITSKQFMLVLTLAHSEAALQSALS